MNEMILKSLIVGISVIGLLALRYGWPALRDLLIRRRRMEEAMYHYKKFHKR